MHDDKPRAEERYSQPAHSRLSLRTLDLKDGSVEIVRLGGGGDGGGEYSTRTSARCVTAADTDSPHFNGANARWT